MKRMSVLIFTMIFSLGACSQMYKLALVEDGIIDENSPNGEIPLEPQDDVILEDIAKNEDKKNNGKSDNSAGEDSSSDGGDSMADGGSNASADSGGDSMADNSGDSNNNMEDDPLANIPDEQPDTNDDPPAGVPDVQDDPKPYDDAIMDEDTGDLWCHDKTVPADEEVSKNDKHKKVLICHFDQGKNNRARGNRFVGIKAWLNGHAKHTSDHLGACGDPDPNNLPLFLPCKE